MKKKMYLMIFLIIISIVLFVPSRVDAVVMWMQCTDQVDGLMDGRQMNYNVYNTFAVINAHPYGDIRGIKHLVYKGSEFYNIKAGKYGVEFGPVFLQYTNDTSYGTGDICWFENYTEVVTDCEGEDKIYFDELLSGTCPVGVVESSQIGATKGDFLALYGKKKPSASNIETLNDDIFVIYPFTYYNSNNNTTSVEYMFEAYTSDGKYVIATTVGKNSSGENVLSSYNPRIDNFTDFKDLTDFRDGLGYPGGDNNKHLITELTVDYGFMDWIMMTQARRIANLGRNYFKLLDYPESWLVGGFPFQTSKVVDSQQLNDGTIIYQTYKSNDSYDTGFGLWVKNWYTEYTDKLEKQLDILEKFESDGDYYNLIKISEEISNKIDEGKAYHFDENTYSAEMMVEELKLAYQDLSLFGNDEIMYTSYDENCQEHYELTPDARAAAYTSFACSVFGVNTLKALPFSSDRFDEADIVVMKKISEYINDISESDIGIENIYDKRKEYAKLLAKSASYIKSNVFFSDEHVRIDIDEYSEKYLEMVRDFGVEIVVDCETLLGDLVDDIKYYTNIIKIAIPIILIGFGVFDFTKAVFAGSDDQIKKAQKDFVKRIGISILIFFVPTIVWLILTLANEVWNFINPSSCGIF